MTVWTWTAADGTVTSLSAWGAGNYVLLDGSGGWLTPAYNFTTQQQANVDGAAVQQVVAAPGAPVLGMEFTASDPAELRGRLRALVHALRPKAGPGVLTATADDGTSRSLPCYYRKGLEAGVQHGTMYRCAVEFYAPSPWWLGPQRSIDTGSFAGPSFFPIFPMRLGSDLLAGTFTVDLSDCDAPAYPQWTVNGPGTALTLANVTTGLSIALTSTLSTTDTVVIDTRPGYQSVRKGDGTNLMGALASDPALWPLVDGRVNTVQVSLANSGPPARILGTYQPRYAGV